MKVGMKRVRRRQQPLARHVERKPARVTDRRIVLLNDGPLRRRAATACQREMAKLDEARAEWRRFEQEDRPAFARWTAVTFGPLLTELRDNASLINERQTLIEEVEMEMIWSNHGNPARAYSAVKQRRENGESADDFPEASDGEAPGASSQGGEGKGAAGVPPGEGPDIEFSAEERAEIFEDFLRSFGGLDPKRLDKAQYAKMFADFEANMLGENASGGLPAAAAAGKSLAGGEEARIKEIYRTLVRRLHPDLRADAETAVAMIWHEVQDAYQARNLERLETLLALTEVQSGTNGGQATLAQMRAALAELRLAFRALRRSIGDAKRDPAWGFCQAGSRARLEIRVRRELEGSLAEQRWVLADLQSTLTQWSSSRPAPARKPKKAPRNVPHATQADLFGS
jgi:hypothetical protein